MLDIHFIRENTEDVKKAVADKGVGCDIDALLDLDVERRTLLKKVEAYRTERNRASDQVAEEQDADKKKKLIERMRTLKEKGKVLESDLRHANERFNTLMLLVPNLPWEDAPVGTDASANKEIKLVGKPTTFTFETKDHITLGNALDLIDLEAGAKTSGFRGYYLKNEAVLMQWALLTLALEKMRKAGFTLMIPPTLVRGFALTGSGHFPFGQEEIYRVANPGRLESGNEEKESIFLTGTSEPSVLAYCANKTFSPNELPLRMCGVSPCYRSEAGSYGKDTKGLFRLHEFWKVEQLIICDNVQKEANKWFDVMLSVAEGMLTDLKLPYRLVETSTGDMGAGKRRMVDVETWVPSQKAYRETHSCSDFTDWQARRLNIKVQKGRKTAFAFTLNNTVIASPRILTAILENYQQKDGSVKVPKVLQKIVGTQVIKA